MSRMAQLEKLLSIDDGDADVLYMLAQEHYKTGAFSEAVRYYDLCLDADPSYCYAYFHKARAQQDGGDSAAAKTTLLDGLSTARREGDKKAVSEITAYLDMIG